jgi:hypothetical protein
MQKNNLKIIIISYLLLREALVLATTGKVG